MSATTNSTAGLSEIAAAKNTSLEVSVQLALQELDSEEPPSAEAIINWARRAYSEHQRSAGSRFVRKSAQLTEAVVRIVDKQEMIELNSSFRDKPNATNVLSFPAEIPAEMADQLSIDLLGDIIICHAVLVEEAIEQQKPLTNHYAHMVTHGVLHLCGYDHEDEKSATIMESMEVEILASSGIENPYD